MKINALLDVNVVAHESEDEVAVLLELEAPGGAGRRHSPAGLPPGRPRPQRLDERERHWRARRRRSSRWFVDSSRPTTSDWSPSTTPPRSSSLPVR